MTSGQEGDLRILLLGKTGAGKSATGNTILGRNAFEESKICEKREGNVDGKNIAVIDTPGLFSTSITKEQVKAEIEKCVEMSAPGPHVFLLVIKLGVRFTEEERNSVQWIQENFGEEALHRTIILFTHSDHLKGISLEEYIGKSHYLPTIVDSCGGRYHSFNNEDRNNPQQVRKLLQKMNALRREHGVMHYTPEMFKRAQTEMTGKDKMNLPKFSYILCAIVLIGVLLGTQQWKNWLQKEELKLKNDIQLIEQDIKQMERELRDNKHREQCLTTDLQQKEQEQQHLRNELSLKEREIQLKNELLQKAENGQHLINELQKKEQEQQHLRNELSLKEREIQLKNELLQKAENGQHMKNELQKKKQENLQLKEELLQKEQEKLKLNEEFVEKEQEKLKLNEEFLQKEQEKLQLKKELLQKEKEEWQLNEKLLQKEQEKEDLKKDLQQKEQKNQQVTNDLRQKESKKQQLEKKLLQYNQKVQ